MKHSAQANERESRGQCGAPGGQLARRLRGNPHSGGRIWSWMPSSGFIPGPVTTCCSSEPRLESLRK